MISSLSSISRLSIIGLGAVLAPHGAMAFDSGSTGADGAFSPTANTQVQLPPNGIFNFTTVNIPSGVTVTFKKNATNTPVVILASSNVTIAGTIDVSGSRSADAGTWGNGNIADDGLPGVGGPGGYDGGRGGSIGANYPAGGNGLGPGGGGGGNKLNGGGAYGGGGGFRTAGGMYGTGHGAGGGTGGTNFRGVGGGGGGGALLIASSGTVYLSGAIVADGGASGNASGDGAGMAAGGGSGGAIRVVATTINGNGNFYARGGSGVGSGGSGGIRLEAENFIRSGGTSLPNYSFGAPGTVFVPGLPALSITSVAGAPAPAAPTGNADITLPADTTNPVTVTLTTTSVPLDSVIKLTVTPAAGANITATSGPLTGTQESATASVSVSLPAGASTLTATTSYSVTTAMGDALSMYAQGERVERIELSASMQDGPAITLITISGKRHSIAHADFTAYSPG